MQKRQIILDTETTGLSASEGHRIIEIGCIEIIDRQITSNHYHQYIQPERAVDKGAYAVHGLGDEFLADKPLFSEIADDFIDFIKDSELIIHNAPFDIGFIDAELERLAGRHALVANNNPIVDTLALARKKHPGMKNSLDALCKRYQVDNRTRTWHGALLDAQLLAQVYLAMTGEQFRLFMQSEGHSQSEAQEVQASTTVRTDAAQLIVIQANQDDCKAHQKRLKDIDKSSHGQCVWLKDDKE